LRPPSNAPFIADIHRSGVIRASALITPPKRAPLTKSAFKREFNGCCGDYTRTCRHHAGIDPLDFAVRGSEVISFLENMDITSSFLLYRETARHVWNTAFVGHIPNVDWNARDGFCDACLSLFKEIVLVPSGLDPECSQADYASPAFVYESIVLKPKGPSLAFPILINREKGVDSGYWDHPIDVFSNKDGLLKFSKFFDWNDLAKRDFQYVMTKIESSNQDIDGRFALVEPQYIDFHKL
jgi:hypothetical protein